MMSDLARFRARGHFAGLNGLRCAAIAAVVWHHVYDRRGHPLDMGFLGVDLFFVLSGFLITTLLLRERDATRSISLRRFWARRALRLLPPFYLLLALLGVYYAVRGGVPAARFFHTLPTDAIYLSNWRASAGPGLSILWSLATEQQFYLVWPLVELLGRRVSVPVLIGFIGVNQLVNFDVLTVFDGYPIADATYTPICLGVLLAHLLDSPRSHGPTARVLGRRATLYATLAALALLAATAPPDISGAPRLAIQLLMAVLIGAFVMQPDGPATRVLELAPIERIGVVSYGIYLYHLCVRTPVAALAARAELDAPVPLFVLTLAATWAVAELSFRLFEQPILRLSHRFRAPRRHSIAPLRAEPNI